MIISEMQRKLATWAATDPSRRIERLLRLITQPEWLAEAARITLSSKGAYTPGVDGVNKATLPAGSVFRVDAMVSFLATNPLSSNLAYNVCSVTRGGAVIARGRRTWKKHRA